MTFTAGETVTAAALNLATAHLIARADRQTTSTGTTTEVGVVRLDDIPIKAERLYFIIWNGHLDGNTANDAIAGRVRYTTDGSTPTTSSTTLPGSDCDFDQVDAAIGHTVLQMTDYVPASDETLSLLLCVARIQGTGTVAMGNGATNPTKMWVWDFGEDVGDTGTDI